MNEMHFQSFRSTLSFSLDKVTKIRYNTNEIHSGEEQWKN
uniref:Uncharacterized protein n=1 Tax=Caudovirales sp. ctTVN2 TaxID=2827634 RepID=A0A8S5S856_9CAUD|nr:MAG TPA: hypothetical protein [Caudovirales sp. ctTVN2]